MLHLLTQIANDYCRFKKCAVLVLVQYGRDYSQLFLFAGTPIAFYLSVFTQCKNTCVPGCCECQIAKLKIGNWLVVMWVCRAKIYYCEIYRYKLLSVMFNLRMVNVWEVFEIEEVISWSRFVARCCCHWPQPFRIYSLCCGITDCLISVSSSCLFWLPVNQNPGKIIGGYLLRLRLQKCLMQF